MNKNQIDIIIAMRSSGKTYNEIADVISVPKNTVKTYCNRHNIKVGNEQCDIGYCKHCGAVIKQNGKNKSRSFCSDDCRYAYWNEKRKGSVNKVNSTGILPSNLMALILCC